MMGTWANNASHIEINHCDRCEYASAVDIIELIHPFHSLINSRAPIDVTDNTKQ
jgi:hypothetical protein